MIRPDAFWVVCEGTDETHLALLGKARDLLGEDGQVIALLACRRLDADACVYAGADVVIALDGAEDDPCRVGDAIAEAIAEYRAEVALFPATVRGRMLSAWVAARLDTGLTADCTALTMTDEGLLLQIRPAFGGNLTAEILCRERRPQMASVRPGVFAIPEPDSSRRAKTLHRTMDGKAYLTCEAHVPAKAECSLSDAEVIVAGGKGIGSQKGFMMLERLAALLGGAVGATRSAVDAGYIGYTHQIGQTGVTVRPRLYIAVAISGKVQHIVGMNGAETVIAINNDRRAPIFSHANRGIVAHWEDAVGEMIRRLEKERKS